MLILVKDRIEQHRLKMWLGLVLLFVLGLTCVGARGPHHPSGKVAQHHVHYKPSKINGESKFNQDEQLLHDTEHLQEHLGEMNQEIDLSKLSKEELEFYYFQLHDADHNSKLDGLEILQAIMHTTHSLEENENSTASQANDIAYYIELIDKALEEDDVDKDGFLNYPEFISGGRKPSIQPQVKMV
ncbi:multiple coagulation factor deficiency protein 2 homolog isoform X2 [Onthophagus taurus]|uniref:multiple coagulation factor deficiency protein 2 homolog isoform X1 n=1 Tax=Onthophagus taurus TaxID=166361 RepID=UPI000C1FDF8F|nr:multiple coagulation factor deficiency protein 2 homolog [Onthophagus taurus]